MVQSERSIILPNMQKEAANSLQKVFDSDGYGVFILCFNNLCYDNLDDVLLDYYTHEIDKIDWNQMLRELNIKKRIGWSLMNTPLIKKNVYYVAFLRIKEYPWKIWQRASPYILSESTHL